jgi:hypothetical protein
MEHAFARRLRDVRVRKRAAKLGPVAQLVRARA